MKEFQPEYWSTYIERELEKALILSKQDCCDYKFDQKDFKKGARLKIIGAVPVSVHEYTIGTDITVDELDADSQYLDIEYSDYFAFGIEDDDKDKGLDNFYSTEMDQAKNSLASKCDEKVGELAKNSLTGMTSQSTDISGATNPLSVLDVARMALYKNNVPQTQVIYADLSAEHLVLIQAKFANLFTDNVEFVKKGALGKYMNTYLRMSNNLYNDGTDDYEMVRTNKAIAVASRINKIEKIRDTKKFRDIVRGYHTYGCKLVRPKELYVIKVH